MLAHIPVWPNWQGVSLLRSEVEVRILPPERSATIHRVVTVTTGSWPNWEGSGLAHRRVGVRIPLTPRRINESRSTTVSKLTWHKRPVEARETLVRFQGTPRRTDATTRDTSTEKGPNGLAVRFRKTLASPGSRFVHTQLAQWESTCVTCRRRRFESVTGDDVDANWMAPSVARLPMREEELSSNPAGPRSMVSNTSHTRTSSRRSWDQNIDGDVPGSYPGEPGSNPGGPTTADAIGLVPSPFKAHTPRPDGFSAATPGSLNGRAPASHAGDGGSTPPPGSNAVARRLRKVAGSGAQPASKPGPGERLMVRLHHLPPLPDGATGSTPGSEPGGRSSNLRLAAVDPMRSMGVLRWTRSWCWYTAGRKAHASGFSDRSCDRCVNGSARQPATLEVGVRISPITPRVGGANRLTHWSQKPAP